MHIRKLPALHVLKSQTFFVNSPEGRTVRDTNPLHGAALNGKPLWLHGAARAGKERQLHGAAQTCNFTGYLTANRSCILPRNLSHRNYNKKS